MMGPYCLIDAKLFSSLRPIRHKRLNYTISIVSFSQGRKPSVLGPKTSRAGIGTVRHSMSGDIAPCFHSGLHPANQTNPSGRCSALEPNAFNVR